MGLVRDNTTSGLFPVPLELNLAAVASRSSLVGALLRNAIIAKRHILLDFLQGLRRPRKPAGLTKSHTGRLFECEHGLMLNIGRNDF